jgi:hypothetical protein
MLSIPLFRGNGAANIGKCLLTRNRFLALFYVVFGHAFGRIHFQE